MILALTQVAVRDAAALDRWLSDPAAWAELRTHLAGALERDAKPESLVAAG